MKTKIILALFLVLTASNLAVWGKAKYVTRWKDPEAQPATWKGKKILAFVRTRVTNARPGAEQAMVRELEKLGIQGVPGTSLFPPETERNREMARRILTEAAITGALIMHVIEVKEEMLYGSGQTPYLTPSYATILLRLGNRVECRAFRPVLRDSDRHPRRRDTRVLRRSG